MNAILKLLVESLMEFVLAFYEREKAQANEYTVLSQKKLIESIADVRKAELKINKAAGPVSVSPRAWNQGRMLDLALALVAFLFLSGCLTQTIFVHQPLPIIEVLERPQINEDVLNEREQAIISYAISLEMRIDAYNHYAREQNLKP